VKVLRTEEFNIWFSKCSIKEQALIDARVSRIEAFDHFGNWKYLNDGVAELKWKSGLRIYFARVGQKIILLLNGGKKNAQKKDIQKAKNILQRYASI